jgi:hypothetical protein
MAAIRGVAELEKLAKGFAAGKYVLDEDDGIVERTA